MRLFNSDLNKYKKYSGKPSLVLLLTQQGLWALFVYRSGHRIYKSKLPKLFKKPLLILWVLWQKLIEISAGISIPYTAIIGHSFYIGHFGGIIVNANAVIGDNCNISQGVTIGVSGKGAQRGVPILGNNIYIGAGAIVAGKINIGDGAVIGANSLVIRDVASGTTVVGVPAKMVSESNSNEYI
ncbi:serine O-acetyltransferase [Patiriisocius sp. Uisw_017]|jgi:serine O-acetyltransferase|uniref:serine O-acetyltransferase n=1 Tax=Patiriisocius sp. Uisw_017 TaxID=3230968 RepID=UPI0039E7BA6E